MRRRRYRFGIGLMLLVLLARVAGMHGTGSVVARTVAVGMTPSHVVVDRRTGHVFVTNYRDSTVTMLDARSGDALRTVAVSTGPLDVVVDAGTGRAFVPVSTLGTDVLDTATGGRVGTAQIVQADVAAVDDQTGHVFVETGCIGRLGVAMLDARSGIPLRSVVVGHGSHSMAVDTRTHRAFIPNSMDGTVSMLDTSTGKPLRTVTVGNNPRGVAIDPGRDRVFVTNQGSNSVTILDARSGTVLRTVAVGMGPQTLAVATGAGRVFVVNGLDNTVSVLDAGTGSLLGTVSVGKATWSRPQSAGVENPVDVAVDQRRDRVFVINGTPVAGNGAPARGSMSVLDARSGRRLRVIDLGMAPVALAVDEATSRLFAVNSGVEGQSSAWGWIPQGVRSWLPQLVRSSAPTGSVSVIDTSRL